MLEHPIAKYVTPGGSLLGAVEAKKGGWVDGMLVAC